MKKILPILFLIGAFICSAQRNQSEYLEAKRQFTQGNYRDAMGGFQILTNDEVFGAYASFYYALCAYNLEIYNVALDMWKQVLSKYPNWDQAAEVKFWIAKTSFERNRYLDGIKHSDMLPEDIRTQLINSIDLNYENLKGLYEANAENQKLAELYFRSITQKPFEERDFDVILDLANKFGFDANEASDFPYVEKDTLAVAIVLPFMFDSLQNPQSVIQNKIIYELYEGMLLAQDSLLKKGISLDFFPYDTKKMGYRAESLSRQNTLQNADVIVGPLYSDPISHISKYALENEIPMINPLSSNGSLVQDNEFSYLFKPSYETQGRKAGEFAVREFTENKNAIIYFETARDETVAEAYKKELEADSFNIVLYDQLTKEDALQLQVDFTDEYEFLLDSISQEEIDSIALIPGRLVRSRPKKNEETGRIIKDSKGEDVLEYYEMIYTIPMDTIGHIFLASSNNLLANNIISIANLRRDTISVLGYDDWLNFKLVSYQQFERLGISLIHTSLFDDEASEAVSSKLRKRNWTEASEYHLIGFELIMQLGHLFNEYGKYFQRGLISNAKLDGFIMEGLSYGSYRDNQVVPIVKIEDLSLKIQNSEIDEE